MNNQNHIDANLYFKGKVILLKNELINLGTFNEDIKATGIKTAKSTLEIARTEKAISLAPSKDA